MSKRLALVLILCGLFTPAAGAADRFRAEIRPLLAKYCFACHGVRKAQGQLNLEKFKSEEEILKAGTVWRGVHDRLRRGEMPPPRQPRPVEAERQLLAAWVQKLIARIEEAAPAGPGRVTMRRLNRVEYRNTIQDLTGLKLDLAFDPTKELPADGAGYGFDNIGDVLSVAPLHVEKYLSVARQILERALVVDGVDGPRVWKYSAKEIRPVGARTDRLAPCHWTVELDVRQPGAYLIRAEVRSNQDSKARAQMAFAADGCRPTRFTYSRQSKIVAVERKLLLQRRGRVQVWIAYEHEQGKNAFEPDDAEQGRIFVERIEVRGPLDIKMAELPESHRRIIIARPGPDRTRRQAAEEVLRAFARRAFRRPVRKGEIEPYLRLFEKADHAGETFEGALLVPLRALLVSPHFLFRVELDRADSSGSYEIGSFELASRLSYFLWSSMPDEELFRLAASGKLSQRIVLAKQVERMLADPRSRALAENFVSQWLQIRGVERLQPAASAGKLGTDLRNAMMQEPVLLFQEILRSNRGILELLDADYTYANAALANHYGLPIAAGNRGKEGDARRMLRYSLRDGKRGGVMTMAAVLAVTSHPDRTSPVRRGKWVLEALLGAAPPPPPADVGELPADANSGVTLSIRQRLEAHRRKPTCAACHQRMDAIGFGFENYDVLGRWRDRDGKQPVDASARLPDGRSFDGPVELKKILLEQKDDFTSCLAEKLLTYALGRGLEPADRPVVAKLARETAREQYRLRRLVLEIVISAPFRRRALAPAKNDPTSTRR